MRRVSFADAPDEFWLVLFPDEPDQDATIRDWALEMLHHPDPNQGPALRKMKHPNPDLADRISLTIEGRTLTLGIAVNSGETLSFSRYLKHIPDLTECLPKENSIHALLRGPQHQYCHDQVRNFLGSVANQISATIYGVLKSALTDRRLTIWGPNPAKPYGRLTKLAVLPDKLDRVEISGPATARGQEVEQHFEKADRLIVQEIRALQTGPKPTSVNAAATQMVRGGKVRRQEGATDESVIKRIRNRYTREYGKKSKRSR